MSNKVSIIVTIYNQENYLTETVESAINQTYNDKEIICIDDCSTDSSFQILQKLKEKYPQIKILKNKTNHGVVYTRNKAINLASGEYILPLDADDIIDPTYVEKAANILNSEPTVGIVYCKAQYIGGKNGPWELMSFDKETILLKNIIFSCALFRKSDFIKFGGYKEYMNLGWEDYDLWLSFIENGLDVYRIDEILFSYRKNNNETLSTIAENNKNTNRKKIIKNHIDLYLNSQMFMDRLYHPVLYNKDKLERETKKHKKYKKLFNTFLIISILEFLIIILRFICS